MTRDVEPTFKEMEYVSIELSQRRSKPSPIKVLQYSYQQMSFVDGAFRDSMYSIALRMESGERKLKRYG